MVAHCLEQAKLNLIKDISTDIKPDIEAQKRSIVDQVRLVSFFILINTHSQYPFKKLVKQFETLKVSIAKLECFKDMHFFSWLMLHKMQDKSLKSFKTVKIGDGLVIPVQVQDKKESISLAQSKEQMKLQFKPIGQMLEDTYYQQMVENGSVLNGGRNYVKSGNIKINGLENE